MPLNARGQAATLGQMFELHHLSFAQRAVLGDLRLGPQWEGGLRTQTFRALARRGLVDAVERGVRAYRWRLTPAGTRVVLALGLMPLPWYLRQPFGDPRLPPAERAVRSFGQSMRPTVPRPRWVSE